MAPPDVWFCARVWSQSLLTQPFDPFSILSEKGMLRGVVVIDLTWMLSERNSLQALSPLAFRAFTCQVCEPADNGPAWKAVVGCQLFSTPSSFTLNSVPAPVSSQTNTTVSSEVKSASPFGGQRSDGVDGDEDLGRTRKEDAISAPMRLSARLASFCVMVVPRPVRSVSSNKVA